MGCRALDWADFCVGVRECNTQTLLPLSDVTFVQVHKASPAEHMVRLGAKASGRENLMLALKTSFATSGRIRREDHRWKHDI